MMTTLEYKGVKFDVEFDYEPAEERTRDYEGSSAQVSWIHEFRHQGVCFLEFLENIEDEIKEAILEDLRD